MTPMEKHVDTFIDVQDKEEEDYTLVEYDDCEIDKMYMKLCCLLSQFLESTL